MGKLQVNGDMSASNTISANNGQFVINSGTLLTKRTFSSGWQLGWTFNINDIQMGKFGFYGGTEKMNYFYVGTEYNSTWITITPEGIVTANTFSGSLNGNASSATNSSKLGGYNATEFFRRGDNITASCNDTTTSRSYWATNTATEKPTDWGGLLDFNTGSHHQIYLSYTGNDSYVGLYTRAKVNGVWQPWSRYLNTDNYSSFAVPLKVHDSGTPNFNNITTTAWNSIVAGNTNSPTTGNHGLLLSEMNVGTPFQIWYPDNSLQMWKRYKPSGSDWTSWSNTWDINVTGSAGSVAWGSITGKPSSYAPSSHTHSYVPLSGGSMSGQLSISINNPGTSPSTQHIILNGQNGSSNVANAPGLAMHIGNMNWSTLKFLSDGSWRFYNSGCNGYMPIYCSKTIVTNYGGTLPSSGDTGEIFYKI